MNVEIARMFAFLGIVILLITAVGGTAPPGWQALQDSLAGQGFPTFTNPFAQNPQLQFIYGLADSDSGWDSTNYFTAIGTANGCAQNAPQKCVIDPGGPDGAATYLHANNSIALNITGLPTKGEIVYGTVEIRCRTPGGATPMQWHFTLQVWIPTTGGAGNAYGNNLGEDVFCRSETQFNVSSGHLHQEQTVYNLNAVSGALQMWLVPFNGGNPTAFFDVSTITVTLTVSLSSSCNGGDFFSNLGCQVGNAFDTLVKFAQLGLNAAIFSFQVAFFALGILFNFFLGLIQAFAWLLGVDPASPMFPAPLLVKLIIGVLVFAALGYVIIESITLVAEVVGAFIP